MSRAGPLPKPFRQAYALAYAMRARPTPALATRYFDALRALLDQPHDKGPAQ